MVYELHVKTISGWQVKGFGTRDEMKAKALKWNEIGYKTKLVRVR